MQAPLADPRAIPSPLDATPMHVRASPDPCSSVMWKNSRLGVSEAVAAAVAVVVAIGPT